MFTSQAETIVSDAAVKLVVMQSILGSLNAARLNSQWISVFVLLNDSACQFP